MRKTQSNCKPTNPKHSHTHFFGMFSNDFVVLITHCRLTTENYTKQHSTHFKTHTHTPNTLYSWTSIGRTADCALGESMDEEQHVARVEPAVRWRRLQASDNEMWYYAIDKSSIVCDKKQKQINGMRVGASQSSLQLPLGHETVDTWTLDHAAHPLAEIEGR